jgi:tRNA A-37 threonylcarbamoyl transferase component Bud32
MEADAKQKKHLTGILINKVLADDEEFQLYQHSTNLLIEDGLVDYLFAVPGELRMPDQVFDRLRWGGQFLFISHDRAEVERCAKPYLKRPEFLVELEHGQVSDGLIPGFKKTYHYFVARKTHLVRVGEFSDRFTYHVELIKDPTDPKRFLVMKGVPTTEQMEKRLDMRYPDMDMADIVRRAKSFTHDIFPLFLTREAGILKVLNKYLPDNTKGRVPQAVEMQKNDRGYLTRFTMTWLRNGHTSDGVPMSHLEFAKQLSGMLQILHEKAKVIHLDLRPDNLVVTREGVGFIDFGSSIRIGEDISRSKMLMKMFEQVMTTSGIQRMLCQMCDSGAVTSQVIRNGYRKIDKAVDLFFMVLQMNNPLANPDLQGLIKHDPDSVEARALRVLIQRVLKPADPENPELKTAADIHAAVCDIVNRHSDSVWKTAVSVAN